MLRFGQQLPMTGQHFTAFKIRGPARQMLEQLWAHKAVSAGHDQLHRYFGMALAWAKQAADKVGPIEFDPVHTVTELSGVDADVIQPLQLAQYPG